MVDLNLPLRYNVVMLIKKGHNNMSNTVTLELTTYQARLLKAAVNAEIIKGSSTFLSGRDVINLGRIADSIIDQLTAQEESV